MFFLTNFYGTLQFWGSNQQTSWILFLDIWSTFLFLKAAHIINSLYTNVPITQIQCDNFNVLSFPTLGTGG